MKKLIAPLAFMAILAFLLPTTLNAQSILTTEVQTGMNANNVFYRSTVTLLGCPDQSHVIVRVNGMPVGDKTFSVGQTHTYTYSISRCESPNNADVTYQIRDCNDYDILPLRVCIVTVAGCTGNYMIP